VRAGRQRQYAAVGIVGVAVFLAASVTTAIAYSGNAGEAYSPLNHWVSELGELGVSAFAPVFNAGDIIGGVCLLIFMIGLAVSRAGWPRFVYGAAGALAGIGGALVGAFPMNNPAPHDLAALIFFDAGWIAVGLASLDFLLRPDARFPPWLAGVGVLTVVAFPALLASLTQLLDSAGLTASSLRPAVWRAPLMEWLALIGILAWVLTSSVTWYRAEAGHGS
jgi:hypothetical membrane protein